MKKTIVLAEVEQKWEGKINVQPIEDSLGQSYEMSYKAPVTVRQYFGKDDQGLPIEFYMWEKLPNGCKISLEYRSGLLGLLLARSSIELEGKKYYITSRKILSYPEDLAEQKLI